MNRSVIREPTVPRIPSLNFDGIIRDGMQNDNKWAGAKTTIKGGVRGTVRFPEK